MNQAEYQQVIEEFDTLITDTRQLMVRFEDTGMDDEMPGDYGKLEAIITQALKDQRLYTLEMLDGTAHTTEPCPARPKPT